MTSDISDYVKWLGIVHNDWLYTLPVTLKEVYRIVQWQRVQFVEWIQIYHIPEPHNWFWFDTNKMGQSGRILFLLHEQQLNVFNFFELFFDSF